MPKVTAQRITDIRSSDQLIRYAAAAQLAKLGISRTKVGEASTLKDYTLARALGDSGKAELTNDRLRMLDEAIVALNPAMESAGGLASLGIRLRGLTSRGSLLVHVPASWVWEMLQQKAETEFDWLVHASALLSLLMPVERTPQMSLEANLERYQDQISPIAKRLALIGLEPPTPRNIDALILLGSLAKYAFDDVKVIIEGYLEKNPLGFRLWRAVTKLVQLSQEPGCSTPPGLRRWVKQLLMDAERLRVKSVYPARSLDLELALAIPANWSQPGGDDWVHGVLITRARNENATVRERGTAAMGLWQRALDKSAPRAAREKTKQELKGLISEFQSGKAVGLHWVAETLEIVLEGEGEPVCNEWPPLQEPWLERVHHAADRLDEENIPVDIREATKTLFRHMLLQNAGVERRHAIDTLVAGGWTGPVAKALGQLSMAVKCSP
ncbi:hypothetical protein [Streptomyces sp. MBT33]|uniref:hypothetical protein n=1 Tax=Streptomyces sp. MBT33 TaxID=1488363 RepID=UPI00190BF5E1|nr:hypothetical protein [Streptomyces sp. MBT33]MBK3643033.1 hypothetical protein [Streptomyces sp. MBT33]